MKHSINSPLRIVLITTTSLFLFLFSSPLNAQSYIADSDNNTKVQVEKDTNNNIIHFEIDGTEQWMMTETRFVPLNTGRSIFIGEGAGGHDNLSDNTNVFIGYRTGFENTIGKHNTLLGPQAGKNNTNGNYNTFVGERSGWNNTTGFRNTFTGSAAGFSNTEGSYNVFSGLNAGYENTGGHHNTFSGTASGYHNQTGNNNTFLGHQAGFENVVGSRNTAVGYYAGVNGSDLMNRTAIGFNAQNTAAHQVRIGNEGVTSIGGYMNWSNISDARMKKEVKDNVAGLDFILKLRPVTYHLDMNAIATHLNTPSEMRLQEAEAMKEKMLQTGFIAQEVEEAAQEIGYEFSGVDAPKNDQDLYGLRYAEFVVPLVKAVQEQQEMISSQTEERDALIEKQNQLIEEQAKQIENLQSQIDQIRQTLQGNNPSAPSSSGDEQNGDPQSSMELFQNVPNPFGETTSISYRLDQPGHVVLSIYTEMGNPVETLVDSFQENGTYKVDWEAAGHSRGIYFYVLSQNEKELSRKMMIIK